jgi:hypothetical protein
MTSTLANIITSFIIWQQFGELLAHRLELLAHILLQSKQQLSAQGKAADLSAAAGTKLPTQDAATRD